MICINNCYYMFIKRGRADDDDDDDGCQLQKQRLLRNIRIPSMSYCSAIGTMTQNTRRSWRAGGRRTNRPIDWVTVTVSGTRDRSDKRPKNIDTVEHKTGINTKTLRRGFAIKKITENCGRVAQSGGDGLAEDYRLRGLSMARWGWDLQSSRF